MYTLRVLHIWQVGSDVTGIGGTGSILRIAMTPSEMPFQFKRLRFSIKLAFGMIIYKVQDEISKVAGIGNSTQPIVCSFLHVNFPKLSILFTKKYLGFFMYILYYFEYLQDWKLNIIEILQVG